MSRVHTTSRRHIIQSERMESWEHEDRSSSGGGSQLPSRSLRNRDHDQLLVWLWTRSWVMIVNGMNKYVTEMSEETQEDCTDDIGDSTGRPVSKARPKQTPRPTSSFSDDHITVSSAKMDRGSDVSFKIYVFSVCWSIRAWLNCLQGGGGAKKRYQYCVDPCSADTILYLPAIQGHSGGKHINPTLQDNVL